MCKSLQLCMCNCACALRLLNLDIENVVWNLDSCSCLWSRINSVSKLGLFPHQVEDLEGTYPAGLSHRIWELKQIQFSKHCILSLPMEVGGLVPLRCEEGRPKAVRDKLSGKGQQQYYWTEAVHVANTDDRPDLSSEGSPTSTKQ
jgi:hypothetical protein